MKHLYSLFLSLLFLLCLGSLHAAQGNAIITLTDGQGNLVTNEECVLSFFSVPQNWSGGTVIQWRSTQYSDATGVLTVTNATSGNWQVRPVDPNMVSFSFYMPVTNGNITVNQWGTALPGNTLPGGSVSYDIFTSDLRYVSWTALTNAVGSLIGTNFTFSGNASYATNSSYATNINNATGTNVSLSGTFNGNLVGNGGGITGVYSSSIVGSVPSALMANTASYATNAGYALWGTNAWYAAYATNAGSATNITGATGFGLNVGGNFSGSFAGFGSQLVGLTGANVIGSVASATNAQNATNIFGAGLVTITNAALTVFTNSILPGTQISAPLSLQPGVTLEIQTNGSNPYYISTNWFGLMMNGNTLGDPHGLTNSSYVGLYCGFPTNVLSFGYLNSYVGYTANHTPGYPAQTEEERLSLKIFGKSLGLWMQDGNFWYLADPVFGTPQNWVPVNEISSGNQLFYTFSWPFSGFHTLYLHLNGGNVCGVFVPSTNAFVKVPHPTMTGIIVGDSITDGAAGYGGHQLWPAQLEDNLIEYGINLVPQGEGGTGYIATNLWGSAVAGVPFIQRLTNNIAAFNPNFVIWAGGINDPTNGLFSAATNCYGSLKALLPNCKQLVIAPWCDFNNAWDFTNSDQIISNAAAVYGLPVIYPDYSAASAWISGSYNLGSGNAVTYGSGYGPHPNALGHQFYSRMLQNFVLTNILTIALSNAYNGSFTGNGAGLTNVASTNIITDSKVLSPTSNQTNYTVNLRPGEIPNEQIVYLANTNAWITFTGTNVADTVRGVFFNAFTDSVPSTVLLNLPGFHTNSTFSIWITNGFGGYFTFYNLDSTGTNLSAVDDGRIQ